jgi:nitrite reductase/ring-hydroxylating ferredoxin subunit
MKKLILLLLIVPFLIHCDDENFNNYNPYLPSYQFSVTINMSLPSYSILKFASNAKLVLDQGGGVNGIIVFNTGSGYRAFDSSCPNQELTSCSMLQISGFNVVCPCDDVQYSLFTGQAVGTQTQYPLKSYRVEQNGDILRIYN